jgi:hypothetical protein
MDDVVEISNDIRAQEHGIARLREDLLLAGQSRSRRASGRLNRLCNSARDWRDARVGGLDVSSSSLLRLSSLSRCQTLDSEAGALG